MLYDRALRYHPSIVGVPTAGDGGELFPACDGGVLLTEGERDEGAEGGSQGMRVKRLPLHDPEVWTRLMESVGLRS
jgi:hypothetical protein